MIFKLSFVPMAMAEFDLMHSGVLRQTGGKWMAKVDRPVAEIGKYRAWLGMGLASEDIDDAATPGEDVEEGTYDVQSLTWRDYMGGVHSQRCNARHSTGDFAPLPDNTTFM